MKRERYLWDGLNSGPGGVQGARTRANGGGEEREKGRRGGESCTCQRGKSNKHRPHAISFPPIRHILPIFLPITYRRGHGHFQKLFFEFSKSYAAEAGYRVPSNRGGEAF